jgi:hypothetical protein
MAIPNPASGMPNQTPLGPTAAQIASATAAMAGPLGVAALAGVPGLAAQNPTYATPPTKTIVNGCSAGGQAGIALNTNVAAFRQVVTGALTANALSTVLSISGRGQVDVLGFYTGDATARTLRLQVVVDGSTVAFDSTTASISSSGQGLAAAGMIFSGSQNLSFGAPIHFNQSLTVNVASSLTETGKSTLIYTAQTY